MEILKKNVFWIVCGVVAALGIALSVLGLNAMGAVTTEMQQASDIQGRLQSAVRKPINKSAIDAEQARVAAIRENFTNVTTNAYEHDARPPLDVKSVEWKTYLKSLSAPPETTPEGEKKARTVPESVFPDNVGQQSLAFRDLYKTEVEERLPALLKADGPPNAQEIAEWAAIIKSEKPQGKTPAPAPSPDTGAVPPASDKAGPKPPTSGLIGVDECKDSAPCRASLDKAHKIFCYIGPDSLEIIGKVMTGDLKDLQTDLLWDAQRSLWVQQDVVASLAAINNRAADELKKEGKDTWVGVLPVKDLISVRVSDYIHEKSEGVAPSKPGGDAPAKPPGIAGESFTNFTSTPMYDVLQFTVKLIVDARRVPDVINEISKDRFHTPIRISYAAEPPNLKMSGKIYGEDPVVNLVVDFESYYFTDIYRPIMPKAILADLGAAPAAPGGGG